MSKKIALITGVSGQDGIYLSKYLLGLGYEVYGATRSYNDNLKKKFENLYISDVKIVECDLSDYTSLYRILIQIRPNEIYNLAAQSSVGKSFNEPLGTFHFNTISVLNILEIIREFMKDVKLYQASSSEMYGKVSNLPITENSIPNPQSPYAISKTAAHQFVKLYRESYNIFAASGILFNHESELRSNTFFVKKLIVDSIKVKRGIKENVVLGNLNIKRDFGYSPNYVEAMYKILQNDTPGDFIICSGKSLLLSDIVDYVFKYLDIDKQKLLIDKTLFRPSEIPDIYGSNKKAKEELKWDYNTDFFDVLKQIIENELNK